MIQKCNKTEGRQGHAAVRNIAGVHVSVEIVKRKINPESEFGDWPCATGVSSLYVYRYITTRGTAA